MVASKSTNTMPHLVGLSLMYCVNTSLPLKGVIASATLNCLWRLYSVSHFDAIRSRWYWRTLNSGLYPCWPWTWTLLSARCKNLLKPDQKHYLAKLQCEKRMWCGPVILNLRQFTYPITISIPTNAFSSLVTLCQGLGLLADWEDLNWVANLFFSTTYSSQTSSVKNLLKQALADSPVNRNVGPSVGNLV